MEARLAVSESKAIVLTEQLAAIGNELADATERGAMAEQSASEARRELVTAKAQASIATIAYQAAELEKAKRQKKQAEKEALQKKLVRLATTNAKNAVKLMHLESSDSARFAKLLKRHAAGSLPACMEYLVPFIRNQLAVLESKGEKRCMWHPMVLEGCDALRRCSRQAYDEWLESGLGALPTSDWLRRRSCDSPGETGEDPELYLAFGSELDNAGVPPNLREVALLYDEINAVGSLTFKLVKGRYACGAPSQPLPCLQTLASDPACYRLMSTSANGCRYRFFGTVDNAHSDRVFRKKIKKQLTPEQRCERLKASHVLCFMAVMVHDVSSYVPEKVLRRVVGIHAVRDCVAEDINELKWQTIANLRLYAKVRTVVTTKDGSGPNRLDDKCDTSGMGRGTSNMYVTTVIHNDVEADPDAIIHAISDMPHALKKLVSHMFKSYFGSTSRAMYATDMPTQHGSLQLHACHTHMRACMRLHAHMLMAVCSLQVLAKAYRADGSQVGRYSAGRACLQSTTMIPTDLAFCASCVVGSEGCFRSQVTDKPTTSAGQPKALRPTSMSVHACGSCSV